MRHIPFCALLLCCVALMTGCDRQGNKTQPSPKTVDYAAVVTPTFDADSAFQYVADQLSFGFRIPGSDAHRRCADYLVRQMSRWCDTVQVQDFTTQLWDGTSVRGRNIIASLNPEHERRVLLAAHWDSRAWADHDPDEAMHRKPVAGANDGASGVAVLMEMARAMRGLPPNVGVDFIFFDIEDQGIPEWTDKYEDNTWCKGSQHWGHHPHRPFYTAAYGVLFDMVGTTNPRYTKEEVSRHYASGITNKLWATATALGHGQIFVDQPTGAILDDHLYVNQILGIPVVDVVQNSPESSFFTHWHTVGDDLTTIDKHTLSIVAQVTLKTIYGDYPSQP